MTHASLQTRFEAAYLLIARVSLGRAKEISKRVPYISVGYDAYPTKKALAEAFKSSTPETPFKLNIRGGGESLLGSSLSDEAFKLWHASHVREQSLETSATNHMETVNMYIDAGLPSGDARLLLGGIVMYGLGRMQDARAYFMRHAEGTLAWKQELC